ncbi:MAG: DUF1659 domain-containing protein [Selenomonadaceae bacterium]|jgi:hypothetical protein
MAVKSNQTSKMILKVQTGTSSTGAAVYSTRSFAHINPTLTDNDFVTIGAAVGALQANTVGSINRQDAAKLAAE